jgi:ubiquinone/menaquinone biosynthesis C-methylase UbiE
MRNANLFQKYSPGNHWEKQSLSYSKKFINFLKENKIKKGILIDAGCGIGKDTTIFTHGLPEMTVIGLDQDKNIISKGGNKFTDANFMVRNIEELDFSDNLVTAYFMINVIHYVDEEKALNEIYRTLMPGGHLYIHFNLEIIDKNGNIDYQRSEEEILNLFNKFKIVHKNKLSREDLTPVAHHHHILELILRKQY